MRNSTRGESLSLSDMVLGFFEETEGERSWDNNDNRDNDDNDNNNNSNNGEGSTANAAERKAFWESQDQLLQVNLLHSPDRSVSAILLKQFMLFI